MTYYSKETTLSQRAKVVEFIEIVKDAPFTCAKFRQESSRSPIAFQFLDHLASFRVLELVQITDGCMRPHWDLVSCQRMETH